MDSDIKQCSHFRERWFERLNEAPPSRQELQDILAKSVRIQRGLTIYDHAGRLVVVPSLYWCAEKRAVIKVDPRTRKAITVLTEGMQDDVDFLQKI